MPSRLRFLPLLAALGAAIVLTALVFSQVRLRTDLAGLLPHGRTQEARFMLRELRSGAATRLIVIGIDGAPPARLARISRDMTARLDRSGLFRLVRNGGGSLADSPDAAFMFGHRYLLSPAVTPEAFTVPALRRDMRRVLDGLQSSAAPLVERFGFADPTGAFLPLAAAWTGSSGIRRAHGVWFAAKRDRALILAETRAGGTDLTAQRAVVGAIHAAFAAADPGPARLRATGTAILSTDAARTIRGDVEHLSVLSTLGVMLLLIWRFRSPWVIAAIAVPVVLGIGLAALAVQMAYGAVQGVAFGFGMTMLGVSVDYPVLLIGHRKRGEAPPATIRRIGRAFALAVTTAAIGLTGMLFAGFPGIAQLGLFAVVGLLGAALLTRFLLPPLIVAADLAPVAAGDPARVLRVERWRRFRWIGVAVCAAAFVALLAMGGPRWERDLAHLSPVPRAALALDRELRGEIGAPDAGQLGVIRASSAEEVLRREEALLPALDRLRAEKVISGAELAARLLPSEATQRARIAALPPPAVLAERVAAAQAGMPFRPDAFAPFLRDVAAARAMTPLRPDDVTVPLLAARLAPLLFHRDGAWYGLIAPAGVADPSRLAAALRAASATYIDIGAETGRIVAASTRAALRWLGYGALAACVVLVLGLRDVARAARVAGAVGAALLVTVALLTAAGARLSLVHVVSLQFVAGVGLDYALFFARPQLDIEERARTFRTLVTCNVMTLLTFGLLAAARTPLLHDIGSTVVIGAAASLVFGFLFAGKLPREDESA